MPTKFVLYPLYQNKVLKEIPLLQCDCTDNFLTRTQYSWWTYWLINTNITCIKIRKIILHTHIVIIRSTKFSKRQLSSEILGAMETWKCVQFSRTRSIIKILAKWISNNKACNASHTDISNYKKISIRCHINGTFWYTNVFMFFRWLLTSLTGICSKYEVSNIVWTGRTRCRRGFFFYHHGIFVVAKLAVEMIVMHVNVYFLKRSLARTHYIKWIISKRCFIIHLKLWYHHVIKMLTSEVIQQSDDHIHEQKYEFQRLVVVKRPFCRKYCHKCLGLRRTQVRDHRRETVALIAATWQMRLAHFFNFQEMLKHPFYCPPWDAKRHRTCRQCWRAKSRKFKITTYRSFASNTTCRFNPYKHLLLSIRFGILSW